jgi:alpha-tubulin suppressor-like RCC1 family protein
LSNGSLWCSRIIKDECSSLTPSGQKLLNVRLANVNIGFSVFVQLDGGEWRVANDRTSVFDWYLHGPIWRNANLTANPAIEPLSSRFGRELPGNWLVSSDPSDDVQQLVSQLRRANITLVDARMCGGNDMLLLANGSALLHSSDFRSPFPPFQPPAAAQGHVIGFACIDSSYIALLANGSTVSWGYAVKALVTPPPLPSGRRITAMALGDLHSLFLQDDGAVLQSGHMASDGPAVPVAAANQPVLDFAAGSGVAVVLTDAGNVISWGFLLTLVTEADIPAAVKSSTITAVAAGSSFALALSSSGRVHQWGQTMAINMNRTHVPVEALSDVTAISAAGLTALALLGNGSLVFWGDGHCVANDSFSGDFLFDVDGPPASGVVRLPWLVGANISTIRVSENYGLALLSNGSVLQWGCDSENGEWLGQIDVPSGAQKEVVEVAAGQKYAMARTADNKLVIWGNSSVVDNTPKSLLEPAALNITAISAGYDHALALLANGSVMAWGEDMNSSAVWNVPDSVRQGRVVRMSAGDGFSMALVEPPSTQPPPPPAPGVKDKDVRCA